MLSVREKKGIDTYMTKNNTKTSKKDLIRRIVIAVIAMCLIAALLLPILLRAEEAEAYVPYDAQNTIQDALVSPTLQGSAQGQTPITTTNTGKMDSDYNRYMEYLFNHTDASGNVVFSSESLRIALDMYKELLTEEDREQILQFLDSVPYLDYQGTDTFKIINRLWVNEEKQFTLPEDNPVYPYMYQMNMRDSAKATAEKNQFVAKETNGFITSTPTVLNADVLFDAMNILYFKDKWADGDKQVKSKEETFTNADGTKSKVKMMYESSDAYQRGSNAVSYTMAYEDGFLFTVVLPDEGVNPEEVNLDEFLSDNLRYTNADVYFEMPEFEISSVHTISFEDFGMIPGEMNPDIYSGPTPAPSITQVDKIVVDHEGTEAAAVTEIIRETVALPEPEQQHIDIICNRPFLFYITDSMNQDVAFMGVVRTLNNTNSSTDS